MPPSLTPPLLPSLLNWLRANGIDPDRMPEKSPICISEMPDGQRLINYTEFVFDQDGNIVIDDATDLCRREARTTPCAVEPYPDLRIPVHVY
jgi:hypothetical protein